MKMGITLLVCMPWLCCALTPRESQKIGMRIWHNEASNRRDYLAFWSEHEPFPSLGIGHFIWYPQGQQPVYFYPKIPFFHSLPNTP